MRMSCGDEIVDPFTLRVAKKGLTILEIFLQQKYFVKYLKEKVLIRSQTTYLFHIFCEFSLYSLVISKSMRVADGTFYKNFKCKCIEFLTLMQLVANLANTKWSTKFEKFANKKIHKKAEKWLKTWLMDIYLRALSESYPMNTNMTRFGSFSKIFASLCFGWK